MKHTFTLGLIFSLALAIGATGTAKEGTMRKYTKPSKEELKKKLTPLQFEVTQEEGTERPFSNEYWDNHEAGIYVDVASGEPLFSSLDKYDSGTGWPSFSRPLAKENIVEKVDKRLFSTRTEVRSKHGDSHLGHVFDDGPKPTGMRYCMNSASLRFVPVAKLESEGYGEYVALFGKERETAAAPAADGTDRAIFAGGCFWCMEPPFEKLDGVVSVTSGYTGGTVDSPSYEQVSNGGTGHKEAVEIVFDPKKVSYEKLLEVFWRNIDPLDASGQFCDKGDQYRSAIYYRNDAQKKLAEASKEKIAKSGKLKGTIATELVAATKFHAAEGYHQDYYKHNPIRYKFYRGRCGRDQRLEEVWGKAS